MDLTSRRALGLAIVLSFACTVEPAPPPPNAASEPEPEPEVDTISRTGIEGSNCAGAAPAMLAPDGLAYPFQSVVAYYYEMLHAFWATADGAAVLTTWLDPVIEATSEAFWEWQAKSLQIYRDRGDLGFAHRFYRGTFGFLERPATVATCMPALTPERRLVGMLAHVALSQAGVCGKNDDGTTKFWQVNNIALLQIGDVVDAYSLIGSGLARAVAMAPASRCILPPAGAPPPAPTPLEHIDPLVPCRVAFRDDAVTEGIVLPVPSFASVSRVWLPHRAFTAAGTVSMPNDLNEVRSILRSDELRAMFAIGLPRFVPAPERGPTMVRLVGHRIGPALEPSELLLPEELDWVDQHAGEYTTACCRTRCDEPRTLVSTPGDAPHCQTVCTPEGLCASGEARDGLVVMVSSVTTKECFGSCPEPATGAPSVGPSCTP